MAKKTFRPYDPQARVELPGDLRQYLPVDHPVFLLEDLVEGLDLRPITSVYEQGDGRGQPPYHPVLLTRLLLHASSEGETSSRVILRKTSEDSGYRVLCVDQHPDVRTISAVRERHLPAFLVAFKDTVDLAKLLGQVRLEHVAQDGSTNLANASTHKAMSDEHLGQTETRLGQESADILKRAQETDAAEDARYGREQSGDEGPVSAQREVDVRQGRRARIRAAKAALEARVAAEAAAQAPVDPAQQPPPRLVVPDQVAPAPTVDALPSDPPSLTLVLTVPVTEPEERASAPPAVVPDAADQYNFTDPESRIMPSKDGFVQGYNAQIAVDRVCQIIVACDVTQDCTDPRQLQPLLDQVRQNTGDLPEQYSADSGSRSEENVAGLEGRGIDPYIPPPRPRRRKDGTISTTPTTPAKARMQEKLATPAGKRISSLRKETAEPVFGQMKDGRGLRRFRTRGLATVRGEWALWCLTHNLCKLMGVLRGQQRAARTTPVQAIGAQSRLIGAPSVLRRTAQALILEPRTTLSRPNSLVAPTPLLIQTRS